MTGPPTAPSEPVRRLLSYAVEGELPPAPTCTALVDQAEAARHDNPDSAESIAAMMLCRALQRARQTLDAGDDTELSMAAVATSISMWATCARAGA